MRTTPSSQETNQGLSRVQVRGPRVVLSGRLPLGSRGGDALLETGPTYHSPFGTRTTRMRANGTGPTRKGFVVFWGPCGR